MGNMFASLKAQLVSMDLVRHMRYAAEEKGKIELPATTKIEWKDIMPLPFGKTTEPVITTTTSKEVVRIA